MEDPLLGRVGDEERLAADDRALADEAVLAREGAHQLHRRARRRRALGGEAGELVHREERGAAVRERRGVGARRARRLAEGEAVLVRDRVVALVVSISVVHLRHLADQVLRRVRQQRRRVVRRDAPLLAHVPRKVAVVDHRPEGARRPVERRHVDLWRHRRRQNCAAHSVRELRSPSPVAGRRRLHRRRSAPRSGRRRQWHLGRS